MSKQTKKSSRNWTKAATNLFYEILADPINNFMQTLKRYKKPEQRKFTMQLLLKWKKQRKQSRFNQEMLLAVKI